MRKTKNISDLLFSTDVQRMSSTEYSNWIKLLESCQQRGYSSIKQGIVSVENMHGKTESICYVKATLEFAAPEAYYFLFRKGLKSKTFYLISKLWIFNPDNSDIKSDNNRIVIEGIVNNKNIELASVLIV